MCNTFILHAYSGKSSTRIRHAFTEVLLLETCKIKLYSQCGLNLWHNVYQNIDMNFLNNIKIKKLVLIKYCTWIGFIDIQVAFRKQSSDHDWAGQMTFPLSLTDLIFLKCSRDMEIDPLWCHIGCRNVPQEGRFWLSRCFTLLGDCVIMRIRPSEFAEGPVQLYLTARMVHSQQSGRAFG